MSKQYKYLNYDGLNALVTNIKDKFTEVDNKFSQYALKTTPPNNEIWYTSTDGNIVTPNNSDGFGANIVSNTYSDGKGVIKFDGDVTSIGENAFNTCMSLTSVTIPNSITSIGSSAFYSCAYLTNINIPDGVASIGSYAFQDCSGLTSVTIPDSVTSIGENAFYYCESLTSITIPDSVTSIGEYAFYYCKSLTSITIPDSVTSIGEYAFQDCSGLTSVTIPDSVTSIEEYTFYYCESLTCVYCKPTTPPTLGSGVFYDNASGRKIYVPIESVDAYKTASSWSNYADDIVGCVFEDEVLVSGENIKTINGKSILGSGNIEVSIAQPDWNAGAEEDGHIKGRTHWINTSAMYPLSLGNLREIIYTDDSEEFVESISFDGGEMVQNQFIIWDNNDATPMNEWNGPWMRYEVGPHTGSIPMESTFWTIEYVPYEGTFSDMGYIKFNTYGHPYKDIDKVLNKIFVSGAGSPVRTIDDFYLSDNVAKKLIDISYGSLVIKRNAGILTPGQQYRITDYMTTTAQIDTQSAGHQFDIIVTADDKNTLNEIARACLHEGDTYFSNAGANLEAWQIWYSLDNDTERFAWAHGDAQGKGVIYRMIDEWNNDCPYDFKNIKFRNQLDSSDLNYYYTFNYSNPSGYEDMTVKINSFYNEAWEWAQHEVCNNIIRPRFSPSAQDTYQQSLNYIIFDRKNTYDSENDDYYEGDEIENFYNNEFSIDCSHMIFRNACYGNKFGVECYNNTFGELCYNNTFGNRCHMNTFGNNCHGNTFADNCHRNTFADSCYNNTFGDRCYNNTFGNGCGNNTFVNGCGNNTFGNSCGNNTFGNSCGDNTFGNNCYGNTFVDSCNNNTFGGNCNGNTFGELSQRNTFGINCGGNTFGNYCYGNTFGNDCNHDTFGNNCQRNTFGNNCYGNTFGDTYNTGGHYYQNFALGDGTQYVIFASTGNASSGNYVQNYKTSQGLQGTDSNKLTVSLERNLSCEMKIAKNSNGEVKIYCEADLIA